MKEMLEKARACTGEISNLSTVKKNEALKYMALSLRDNKDLILKNNETDLNNAKDKISEVMMDRLRLNESRIESMAKGIEEVIELKDPVNEVLNEYHKDNGLLIKKVRVPFGVIAIIYESRPNVTSDVAALCLKSGNVSVLRSGKEAFNTSNTIVKLLKEALIKADINPDAINLVQDTTRQSATDLMTASGYVDLLIPRGGKGLIENCVKNATVPVIETGQGICHIYVEKTADFNKALRIIENAKCSRPSVCNAAEVLLIDEDIIDSFIPLLINRLSDKVEFRFDELSNKIADSKPASDT
ncbi:MAG: glutamate-5-semialdehyde dehydrogenase, partial [Erysipelotrichaceae bacterium]